MVLQQGQQGGDGFHHRVAAFFVVAVTAAKGIGNITVHAFGEDVPEEEDVFWQGVETLPERREVRFRHPKDNEATI